MRYYNTTVPGTLVRAIGQLIGEGLLTSDPTRPAEGVRVRWRNPVRRDLIRGLRIAHERARTGTVDDAESAFGMSTTTHTVRPPKAVYEWIPAGRVIADRLDITPETEVLCRTFTWWLEDGTPYQVSRSYIEADLARRTGLTGPEADASRGKETIAQLADAGVHVNRAPIEIESRMPTPRRGEDSRAHAGSTGIRRTPDSLPGC
jgi:hypothetical protein